MKHIVRQLVVDPPSGWKYGFPRACPLVFDRSGTDEANVENDRLLHEWYVSCGYPQRLIDQGQLKYSRSWYKDFEVDTDADNEEEGKAGTS